MTTINKTFVKIFHGLNSVISKNTLSNTLWIYKIRLSYISKNQKVSFIIMNTIKIISLTYLRMVLKKMNPIQLRNTLILDSD